MTTAEQIKATITMADVLDRYGYETNSKGYMKCPFHAAGQEKTPSFHVKGNNFTCYGCNASGSVIDFVMQMENCDFGKAISKLDCGELTFLEKRKIVDRKHEQNKANRIKQAAKDEYHGLLDEWIRLDINSRKYKPISIDEQPNPLFIEALQKLNYQGYLLDCFTKVW